MSASDLKQVLEKRKIAKRKKPVFVRKDAHKKKKMGKAWRRPKGLHNKQRIKGKSHFKTPASGYGSPRQVRWLHSSGLFPVVVSNLKQLDSITKEKHGILLSSRIGDQKRKNLILEIKKRSFVLLNLDADKTIEKIDVKLKQRKEQRKKKLDKAKAKEKEKEKEKKKGIEEKVKKEEEKKPEAKTTETKKVSEPTKALPLSAKDAKDKSLSTAAKPQKPEDKKEEQKQEEITEEEKKKLEKKEKDKLLIKKT